VKTGNNISLISFVLVNVTKTAVVRFPQNRP